MCKCSRFILKRSIKAHLTIFYTKKKNTITLKAIFQVVAMPASQQSVTPCYTWSSWSSCMNNSSPLKPGRRFLANTIWGTQFEHPEPSAWQRYAAAVTIHFEDKDCPWWARFNEAEAGSRSNLPQSTVCSRARFKFQLGVVVDDTTNRLWLEDGSRHGELSLWDLLSGKQTRRAAFQ